MRSDYLPAYTLIELLIVMSILALLASFTVPTYQLILSQLQLTTATNQLADLMRLQEQRTVTEQNVYGVTLVAGATTVPNFLCLNAGCTSKTISTYTLPSNIMIDSETFAATDTLFTTAGAPNFSGTVTLIDTVRGRRRMVAVKPSGAVLANTPEY